MQTKTQTTDQGECAGAPLLWDAFRDLEHLTGLGVFEHRATGSHWSPGMFALLGLSPAVSQPGEQSLLDAVSHEDRELLRGALRASGREARVVLVRGLSGSKPLRVHIHLRDDHSEDGAVCGVVFDRSANRQTLEAPCACQDRMHSFCDAAFEGVVIAEQDRVIDVNTRFEEITGFGRAELIGRLAIDLVHPDDLELVVSKTQTNDAVPFLHRIIRKDGSCAYVQVRSRETTHLGRPARVIAVLDVSAWHGRERELASRTAELEAAFSAISDAIVVTDVERKIVMVNPGFEHILGYTFDEAKGRTTSFFYGTENSFDTVGSALYNPDAPRVHNVYDQLYRRKDGESFWGETLGAHVRGEDGELLGFIGVIRDVSERRESQLRHARLAGAVEHSADEIILTDVEGRILYVNPAFERSTGYGRHEVVGKAPRLLKSDKHDPAFYTQLWSTITGGEVWRGRLTNRTKDGRLIEQDATISPVRDGDGQLVGYVSARRDVTREADLESRASQAQRLEAIGVLAGGIAHDFNNILSGIVGFTELAMIDDDPEEVRTSLSQVLQAAERARALVHHILTFSRQAESEVRPIRIGSIFQEALTLLRASLPATVEIRPRLDSRATVQADPAQMHQVLMNLATNAALAMEDQGGTLEVELQDVTVDAQLAQRLSVPEGPYVVLCVRDNGEGMSPQVAQRIFEPFFTTRSKGKGTGMGMAVVHGIIEAHKGAITVDSEVGRGTECRVYLAVVREREQSGSHQAFAPPKGTGRVMLVDDEDFLRDVASRMMEFLGYEVYAYGSSVEALGTFEADPTAFDVLVTDFTMPKLTGDTLITKCRAVRPDIPVVLCTGYGASLTPERLEALGVDVLLLKPILLQRLAEALHQVCAEG